MKLFLEKYVPCTIVIKSLVLITLGTMVAYSPASATTDPGGVPEAARIDEQLGAQIDLNLQFRDRHGNPVSLERYFRGDIPVIITPVYFGCPRLCTLVVNGLVDALKGMSLKLGKDYRIVTFSFDHTEEAELANEKHKGYSKLLGQEQAAEVAWDFLTGDQKTIASLMQSVGFGYEKDGDEYIHAAGLVVTSPQGVISRYLYGVMFESRDLQLSLVEASDGKVGSTVERVLLYCFRFDNNAGKYTFSILRLSHLVAVLTVVSLVGFIGYLRLAEVRARKTASLENQGNNQKESKS